jgi:hypothetical protein
MWVSKLVLNPASKAARRDLANPYEMHRTLSKAVSEALKEGRERLLWRLEPTRGLEPPVVLVQTLTEPDWSVLEEGYAEVLPRSPLSQPSTLDSASASAWGPTPPSASRPREAGGLEDPGGEGRLAGEAASGGRFPPS